ncbi:hypothetical protein GOP47_0008802 [Adiantum capillus-veneris]|uniref:Uncharacterized protein n=1 Tax=Adiantum capillus-veneris TaxID=13818 RepID=A0A9D4V0I0_ADICA|nr:hypothetical protein GOP47_0008802 [Adiantum capillus-veneris]
MKPFECFGVETPDEILVKLDAGCKAPLGRGYFLKFKKIQALFDELFFLWEFFLVVSRSSDSGCQSPPEEQDLPLLESSLELMHRVGAPPCGELGLWFLGCGKRLFVVLVDRSIGQDTEQVGAGWTAGTFFRQAQARPDARSNKDPRTDNRLARPITDPKCATI